MRTGTEANTYEWIDHWARLPKGAVELGESAHSGMVVNAAGNIMTFHEADHAVITFDPEGTLQDSFATNLENAHDVVVVNEGGSEYLWLVDNKSASVIKTTLEGEVVMRLEPPRIPAYEEGKYSPTSVAVNEERRGGNGDIWVADGYGEWFVHRYDKDGNHLISLNGEEGTGRFNQPHGAWMDWRKDEPELYISDRYNHRAQVFDTEGNFKRDFGPGLLNERSPSGFITHGDQMVVVELRARLTVLDGNDGLVTYLGDNSGVEDVEGWPNPPAEYIEVGKFNGPHGVAADGEGNLYVTELIIGGRLTKLART